MFLFVNFDKLCTHLLVCVLTGAQLSQCLGQYVNILQKFTVTATIAHAMPTSKLSVIYL